MEWRMEQLQGKSRLKGRKERKEKIAQHKHMRNSLLTVLKQQSQLSEAFAAHPAKMLFVFIGQHGPQSIPRGQGKHRRSTVAYSFTSCRCPVGQEVSCECLDPSRSTQQPPSILSRAWSFSAPFSWSRRREVGLSRQQLIVPLR